jgi:hypothetical protein
LSTKEDNGSKESKEPDYDGDKEQLEEKQGEQTGELKEETTNRVRKEQDRVNIVFPNTTRSCSIFLLCHGPT